MASALREIDLQELGRRFFAKEEGVSAAGDRYSRAEIASYIRELAGRITALVEPMTAEQLAFHLPGKPSEWDASEDEEEFDTSQIVTHVAVGTVFYWFSIARTLGHPRPRFPRAPRDTAVTGKQGQIFGRGGWRDVPADELVALLNSTTDDFLSYIATLSTEEERALGTYEGLGDLTVKGWLMLLLVHYGMHLRQIEQLKRLPDFPGNV